MVVTTVVSIMIVPMILGPFEHKAVHSMDRGVVNFLSSLCRAETREPATEPSGLGAIAVTAWDWTC